VTVKTAGADGSQRVDHNLTRRGRHFKLLLAAGVLKPVVMRKRLRLDCSRHGIERFRSSATRK
jgi:hypothetical protein